jgi:hypothetical protein
MAFILGIWGIGLLSLSTLGLDLLLASGLLAVQSLRMRRRSSLYLRIRTPQTITSRTISSSYQSAGEDLFRAAHELLPAARSLALHLAGVCTQRPAG